MANLLIQMLTCDIFVEPNFKVKSPKQRFIGCSMNQDDGDHIGVPNSIKMFSIATLVTRASVWVQELQCVDERLDLQCGEV